MTGIVIGQSEGKNVSIDRKVLMTTRLLITSDSGGGKTWLLKRLIEQSFGDVGIIVIDPEGEFAPLRTKFDFFLVGKGGDTPADIRTAEKVARTLLTGRASAVCDIYEMAASERHLWVKRFLDAGTFSAYLSDLKTARLAIVNRDGTVAANRESLFL